MQLSPNGEINIVHLPGTGSLFSRAFTLYGQRWSKILPLSLMAGVLFVVTYSLTSMLNYLVRDGAHLYKALMEVANTGIELLSVVGYLFIFAAMVCVVKDGAMSLGEVFKKAQGILGSLVWVAVLYLLSFYGGAVTVVLPILFSVWFYFAMYAVVLDGERGVAALAKSRYLTRGMWFKVFGRTMVLAGMIWVLASLASLLLAVPVVGWVLFVLAIAVIAILVMPLQIIYDVLRLEDLVDVPRNVEFLRIKGELWSIRFWAIIGLIIAWFGWSYNLLSCGMRDRVGAAIENGAYVVIATLAPTVGSNVEKLNTLVEKVSYHYNPGCVAPTPTPTLQDSYNSTLPSDYYGGDYSTGGDTESGLTDEEFKKLLEEAGKSSVPQQ